MTVVISNMMDKTVDVSPPTSETVTLRDAEILQGMERRMKDEPA
jgi:hypothetical protein